MANCTFNLSLSHIGVGFFWWIRREYYAQWCNPAEYIYFLKIIVQCLNWEISRVPHPSCVLTIYQYATLTSYKSIFMYNFIVIYLWVDIWMTQKEQMCLSVIIYTGMILHFNTWHCWVSRRVLTWFSEPPENLLLKYNLKQSNRDNEMRWGDQGCAPSPLQLLHSL